MDERERERERGVASFPGSFPLPCCVKEPGYEAKREERRKG